MSCEDLSGNDGKGAFAHCSKPAASRADTSSWEGHSWKGRMKDEEQQQLGSLPRAKDAVFTHLTGARWMPSPGRFAGFGEAGSPGRSGGTKPHVPPVSCCQERSSLGYGNTTLGLCRFEVTALCSVSGMGGI